MKLQLRAALDIESCDCVALVSLPHLLYVVSRHKHTICLQ